MDLDWGKTLLAIGTVITAILGAGGLAVLIPKIGQTARAARQQKAKLRLEDEEARLDMKQKEEDYVIKQHRDLLRLREQQHQAAIAELRADMTFAKAEMHRLSGDFTKLYDEYIKLRKEHDELRTESEDCRARSAQLEHENVKLRQDNLALQQRIEQLEQSVEGWSKAAIERNLDALGSDSRRRPGGG